MFDALKGVERGFWTKSVVFCLVLLLGLGVAVYADGLQELSGDESHFFESYLDLANKVALYVDWPAPFLRTYFYYGMLGVLTSSEDLKPAWGCLFLALNAFYQGRIKDGSLWWGTYLEREIVAFAKKRGLPENFLNELTPSSAYRRYGEILEYKMSNQVTGNELIFGFGIQAVAALYKAYSRVILGLIEVAMSPPFGLDGQGWQLWNSVKLFLTDLFKEASNLQGSARQWKAQKLLSEAVSTAMDALEEAEWEIVTLFPNGLDAAYSAHWRLSGVNYILSEAIKES